MLRQVILVIKQHYHNKKEGWLIMINYNVDGKKLIVNTNKVEFEFNIVK